MMRRLPWPALVVALSLVPVAGLFTTSRIFFVRDLTMHFWPHHLWLKATWAAGHWPWWNPFVAAGRSGIADSLNHTFVLPMTAVRLLAGDAIGFNLWVAAPLPLAALGAYLLLRVDASRPGSALGAVLFALSGPVASSTNFPNLSWTAALMPWVLWRARLAAERPGARAAVALAAAFGMQALCGEPIILGTTALAAVSLACLFGGGALRRRAGVVVAGLTAGAMLASVQLFPLAAAARQSARASFAGEQLWPLHPLNLIETVLPHVFGHYFHALHADRWLMALNDQPAPFFFSLYLGIATLLWTVASRAHEAQRVRRFWLAAALVSLLMAFGGHTPIYAAMQALAPPLRTLRFPIKYFLFTTLALGALASLGWDALRRGERAQASGAGRAIRVASAVAILAAMGALPALAAADRLTSAVRTIAALLGVDNESEAAIELVTRLAVLAPRLAALAAGWALLAWVARRTPARAALPLAALFVLTIADLAVVNADLNPTMPVSLLRAPAWVQAMQARGGGRMYVGGRWGLKSGPRWTDAYYAVDAGRELVVPAEHSAIEGRSLKEHELSLSPSAWGVREVISFDIPMLVSREYVALLKRFVRHTREERLRFLGRVGVRYCVLPQPPAPGATAVARMRILPDMVLYDCVPSATRVSVAPEAAVLDAENDAIDALFRADFDPARAVVLAGDPPPPAGREGPTAAGSGAVIVSDTPDRVIVYASAGEKGGYLTLFDAYDEDWGVTVDGEPAPLLRAFVVFRAVRLKPGRHRVEFVYFPRALAAGAAVSAATAVGLAAVMFLGGRRAGRGREALARREDVRLP